MEVPCASMHDPQGKPRTLDACAWFPPDFTQVLFPFADSTLYVNHELTDVQAGFIKGKGTRDKIANICWIIKKARQFQKNIYFVLLTMSKPLTVWITTICGIFLKRWEYQTILPAS